MPFSRMRLHVVLVRIDAFEEFIASIIRVKKSAS
jgi:hypothetical protein